MVEFALLKIKPAHQRPNRTIAGVHRHESAFDFGQLGNFPGVPGCFRDPNQGTATNFDVRSRLVGQARLTGPQAFSGDDYFFIVLAQRQNSFGIGFHDHRRHDVVVVRVVGQRIVNGILDFLRVRRQVNEFFRPPVDLSPFITHDAFAQGFVGHGLVGGQ